MNWETQLPAASMNTGQELGLERNNSHIDAGRMEYRRIAFAYHEVLPSESPYRYSVTVCQFQEHLSFLRGWKVADEGRSRIMITFDDGHRSNYEHAFPLLEQLSYKATFFALAGRIGTDSQYISWSHAREINTAGHRIESHGWSHRILTLCSQTELREELTISKREIENRLGIGVESISAPGGRWDERVVRACAEAGYKYLFHSNPWQPSRMIHGVRIEGRHMVTNRMEAESIRELIDAGAIRRLSLRAKYGAKERFRQILGDHFYHKIWCWLAHWRPEDGLGLQVSVTPSKKDDLSK